ncbi:hypothetical protein M407DRAFT_242596 [Tulasnella calospora MUT 4182]|uniref:Uncharacterized protein n=1 Tax=Tulasnella calospora MUT 4182 TaxID=1051891 RepID=A0A0C3M758_9AGAM|nr:hypothetical protein M407DRAFT_242596 [Tulasnella calospora MUT 4182]
MFTREALPGMTGLVLNSPPSSPLHSLCSGTPDNLSRFFFVVQKPIHDVEPNLL